MNYQNILEKAFDSAEEVAKQLQKNGKASQPLSHGAFGDLTYQIDKDVETEIMEIIQAYLPKSLIISEEIGLVGDLSGQPIVLIDPVDGSTNAFRNVPFYSSAITIVDGYKFSDVVSAGVVDLVNGDRILSNDNGKVLFNGNSVKPSSTNILDDAYISVNMRIRDMDNEKKWLISLLREIRYPRFLGSAALETAYVAVGKSNAFIQIIPNLRTFDCIGALFLVKSAGGWVEFLNNDIDNVDLRKPERFSYVAASNSTIGDLIMSFRT